MKIQWILSSVLVTGLAQANDTTLYEIPVQGIDPVESKIGTDLVRFYGKEASEFMKLLPSVKTVSPTREAVAEHSKELRLNSKAYTLSFACSDADVEQDENQKVVVNMNPQGAVCKVGLYQLDTEGDTMSFSQDGGKEEVIQQLQKAD